MSDIPNIYCFCVSGAIVIELICIWSDPRKFYIAFIFFSPLSGIWLALIHSWAFSCFLHLWQTRNKMSNLSQQYFRWFCMLVCKQLLNIVHRHNLHISLGRLFDPFGFPGKYFFNFVHPRRVEWVSWLHFLQGSLFSSPGWSLSLGVEHFALFLGPLSFGLFLCFVLS